MTIIVNGEAKEFSGATYISFEDVVSLAGKTGSPSVVYSSPRIADSQRSGTMYKGCAHLRLEPNMYFSVVHTGNA